VNVHFSDLFSLGMYLSVTHLVYDTPFNDPFSLETHLSMIYLV